MQSKILKVFYGEDCLPYKDQERTVHFPLLGNAFQGASQTTEIRFYIKDIGGEDLTWVANAKLPNGKVGTKILTVLNDPDLEEDYALLQLSKFYTQAKGDLYISLQGYDGSEVEMSFDSDTGLYEISGNPTIQATGSIKLTIAYATPLNAGEEIEEPTLQDILAYFDTKLNIGSSAYIKCPNIVNIQNHVFSTEDGYNAGDIIYNKQDKKFGRLITVNSQLRFQMGEIVVDQLSVDDGDHRFNFYVEDFQDPILNIEEDESGKELFFDFAEDEIGFTGNPDVKFQKERLVEIDTFPTTLTTSQYTTLSKQPSYICLSGLNLYYEFAKEDSFYIYFKQIAVPEKINRTTYYELNGMYLRLRKTDRYIEGINDSLNVYNKTQTDGLLDTKADKSTIYTKTEVDGLLDDKADKSNTYTKEETNSAIASAISSVYKYKGSVANYGSLPSSGNTIGDVYNVEDTGDNYAWTGTTWDKLAGTVDLSAYYTASQVDDKLAEKQNVIDSLHKLPSDLVDDTNQTNKFVTSSEKTTWNNKQNALVSGTNIKTINGTSLLDSGDYEFDSSLSDSSTNAVQNKVVKENIDNKANVDGNYPTMSVGQADSIASDREIDNAEQACPPIVFGTVGGEAEVQTGYNKFEELRGNSVAFNQLCENGNFADNSGWTTNNADLSISNNVATVSLNTSAINFLLLRPLKLYNGHKYMYIATVKKSRSDMALRISNSYGGNDVFAANNTGWQTIYTIWTSTFIGSGNSSYPNLYASSAESGDSFQVKNVMLIDLTLLGKDYSTYLEFNRDYPLPYYAYNAGTLLSSKSSALESIGMNQFDEIYRQGATLSGNTNTQVISSVNAIEVISGETYKLKATGFGNVQNEGIYVKGYDTLENAIAGGNNYIDYWNHDASWYDNNIIEFDNNVHYIRIQINFTENTTPTSSNVGKLMVRVWFGDEDSTSIPYQPYEKQTIQLPNIELRSAGSAYDVLYASGGGKRRIGFVDLSELNWYYNPANQRFNCTSPISGIKIPVASQVPNAKCSKYEVVSLNDSTNTKVQLFLYEASRNVYIGIFDSSLNGNTNAITGILFYELATETDIDETENQGWTELVKTDNYGTLNFVSEQSIQVPQAYFIRYTVSLTEWLDSAYAYTYGKPSGLQLHSELNNDITTYLTNISGYDATKTQTLKNINGTFTWVDDE